MQNINIPFCKNIKYCMFIGTSRSGHTLIGYLLNAHKNMAISIEAFVLRHFMQGMKRQEIFAHILRNCASKGKYARHHNFNYKVQGQFQGIYTKNIKVIGNKNGGMASKLFLKYPDLLDNFKTEIKLPFKYIHVIRNPFDILASRFKTKNSFNMAIVEHVFDMLDGTEKVLQKIKKDVFQFKHEDFVKEPKKYIINLCRFLEVEDYETYVEDCAKIVHKKIHKGRFEIQWPTKIKKIINEKIKQYNFLEGYTFDS